VFPKFQRCCFLYKDFAHRPTTGKIYCSYYGYEPQMNTDRRVVLDMAVLLGALAILLYYFQWTTLSKFAVLPPMMSYGTLPRFLQAVQERVPLDSGDLLSAGAICLLCLMVLMLEWRRYRLSFFLGYIFASERRSILFLLAASSVFARCFFSSGDLSWGADAAGHITYAKITADAMANGDIPIWTNYLGLGSPYLQYYGFLFYYLIGLVDLLFGDLYSSMKLVIGLSHILSGLAMYMWIRSVTFSRRAAFLGGVSYVLSFWHFQQVIVMGRLPLALFYMLLPWPFYFCEQMRYRKRWGIGVAGTATTLGMLAFTHPGYGFWASFFWGVYTLARMGGIWGSNRLSLLIKGSVAAALGSVGLGGYLTLGMLLERKETGLRDGIDLVSVADPVWLQVFGWSNFRFWLVPTGVDHWYGGYVGASLAGLVIYSLARRLHHRNSWTCEPLVPACIGLFLALLLVFGYRWSVLQALPVVTAFNAGRYLVFVVLFLAFTVGVGVRVLLMNRRRDQDRILALLVVAIVADLGAATFQSPYSSLEPLAVDPTVYAIPKQQSESYHQQGELPGYRIMWLHESLPAYVSMGQMVYRAETPVVSAPSAHNLRVVDDFCLPLTRMLNHLHESSIENESADTPRYQEFREQGLALLNIRYVLEDIGNGTRVIERRDHTPLIAAPSTVLFPKNKIDAFVRAQGVADLDSVAMYQVYWMVRNMEMDAPHKRSARIFLAEGEKGAQQLLSDNPLEVGILQHRVWNGRAEVRVRVNAACFVRLAYAYSAQVEVRVDGQITEKMQTAGKCIALLLDPGEHTITLEAKLSPLRIGLLALGGLFGLVGIYIAWRSPLQT
jgi:hypothetical protein